ncbi:MAG: sulfatase-like hydrolase/transferase [Bacteroidaceae bacterium]|nr:sulfatase-like hydrolase/transferase [Bacteroidaceae bacterium]
MFLLFLLTLLLFVLQKPLFMLYNADIDPTVSVSDYLAVMWHGLPLDVTTSAYTLVLPWLLLLVAKLVPRFPLRPLLRSYYALVSLLQALIFVADTVMYSFWHFKLDSTVFLYTDKPAAAFASVSPLFLFLCILAILALTAVYGYAYLKVTAQAVKSSRKLWSVLLHLLLAPLLFLMIRGGLGESTANVTKAYYSENQYLNHASVNAAFNLFYSLSHQQNFAQEFQYYDTAAERESLLQGIYHTESTRPDTLLRTTRPDILLIVWEGCAANAAGCMGCPFGATPHLDSLAAHSVFFSNCWANSFRTDRGLVSILSGWLGLPSASLMRLSSKSESLPGIARTLRQAGYTTDFWYGGDIGFTNMGGFMLQNGFQRTHSDKDFTAAEIFNEWGAADGTVFRRILADWQTPSPQPRFTTVMTISSHEPWTVPDYHRLDNEIDNSFAYTDQCIHDLTVSLQAQGLWDNTLVIILPDHGALSRPGYSFSSPQLMHIPLVLTGGAIRQPRRIATLMNQSDLAATLLGQLALPHDDFPFSRDVLSRDYTYPTAIHASKTNLTFIDSTGLTNIDLASDQIVSSTETCDTLPHAQLRARKARAILQTLYLDASRR